MKQEEKQLLVHSWGVMDQRLTLTLRPTHKIHIALKERKKEWMMSCVLYSAEDFILLDLFY